MSQWAEIRHTHEVEGVAWNYVFVAAAYRIAG